MSAPVRPVLLQEPQSAQKWVNADGTPSHYGHRWHHAVFMRLGAYNDDVWRALGVGFTGLTQINMVNQRVDDVEAATAAVQGAVAGLRGDPRLEDAVKALEIAIVALVQVQARASGETDKRLGDMDRIVASFGARLTKAQQAIQFQLDERLAETTSAQVVQTAYLQRLGAVQGDNQAEIEALEAQIAALTTTDVAEGTNLYFTDVRADARISAAVGVSVQAYSANLDTFSGVAPTAAGLALLDDAAASDQRTTLGLGTIATQDAAAVTLGTLRFTPPTYADNAAALAGGLTASDTYKTATGELRIVV